MPFVAAWAAIQERLVIGATIPNWTARKGAFGDAFVIADVDEHVIVVNAPGAATLQRIPRKDFEAVYDRWDDYISGVVQRQMLTPVTRYSKYIISIFHWLEEGSVVPLTKG